MQQGELEELNVNDKTKSNKTGQASTFPTRVIFSRWFVF
jgi:hypothetical protein